jgi:oligopeptide/dipeptide ABC transporter ATP-binding protein
VTKLLEVRDLEKHFPVRGGLLRRVLDIGRTIGLVGESGCGKSTLGRAILLLQRPTGGEVILEGKDLVKLGPKRLLEMRREMQIIFQDPFASLSPRRTVAQTIREPLDVHRIGTSSERNRKVQELLDVVGMRPAVLDRYPHEFSGGQRQRIGIARALALNPKLIVADEAVSALDVSVRAQVLNLIARLQREHGIAFIFISHDLSVVEHVSDHVGVMYLGRIVELAEAKAIYHDPRHPYTQALLSAVPVPDPTRKSKRIVLAGDVPSPMHPPPGCAFHQRCPKAMDICRQIVPPTVEVGTAERPHRVACHLFD